MAYKVLIIYMIYCNASYLYYLYDVLQIIYMAYMI